MLAGLGDIVTALALAWALTCIVRVMPSLNREVHHAIDVALMCK